MFTSAAPLRWRLENRCRRRQSQDPPGRQSKKFIKAVDQITFNGSYAARNGKHVLYITERCVFELTKEGLKLIEVAPGIDIEKDILAHMDFKPIIDNPKPMDARLFQDGPMGVKK